jgi:hypothetical protein
MYQRRRHNSTAVHHPNTLDGRRVAAPVTLPKAPWEKTEVVISLKKQDQMEVRDE